MWGKASYLRKQHDGRDWVLYHRPSDLKSNALIRATTLSRPHPAPLGDAQIQNDLPRPPALCFVGYLTIILRNRAEYHLILS